MERGLNLLLLFVFAFSISAYSQVKSISTENSVLSYQTFGKGPPVLIINGGPGMSSEGFIPLAKLLSENNTIIIYDQRGTGKSYLKTTNSNTVSIDLMLEDIESLREELGYEKWIILGHSFGGMLAYYYASKYPERIKAMIQSHSGGMNLDLSQNFDVTRRLSQDERDSLYFYNFKINQGDTAYKTQLRRAEFLAPAYVYNQKYVSLIAKRLTQGNRRINSLIWQEMRAMRFNTKAAMTNFNKPVLILHGKDEISPVSNATEAHQVLPNSKLIIMENCGHYGWLDRPEVYLKEVANFLKQVN